MRLSHSLLSMIAVPYGSAFVVPVRQATGSSCGAASAACTFVPAQRAATRTCLFPAVGLQVVDGSGDSLRDLASLSARLWVNDGGADIAFNIFVGLLAFLVLSPFAAGLLLVIVVVWGVPIVIKSTQENIQETNPEVWKYTMSKLKPGEALRGRLDLFLEMFVNHLDTKPDGEKDFLDRELEDVLKKARPFFPMLGGLNKELDAIWEEWDDEEKVTSGNSNQDDDDYKSNNTDA